MHVKNHMAMWFLWFLWFLRVEYSANPLYKPLCAFLVFVDLVWFLCGSFCGFWSRVVFALCLALDADADDCASTWRRSLWICGLARPLALDADDCVWSCASFCSLWTAKKICPSIHFVLCSLSSPLGATFTNGENDHG